MATYLIYLLQLIISPSKGWQAIGEASLKPRLLCSEGFFPLIGVVACSVFMRLLYYDEATLPGVIQGAVVTFLAYFITYFLASFLLSLFGPNISENGSDETRNQIFVIFNLSLLAIINLIANCLPMELSIIQFLPLFCCVVMWMGKDFLEIRRDKGVWFLVLGIVSVMVPPYVIERIFTFINN